MKIYKNSTDIIYYYPDDGSQDQLIEDKILITQAEADAIIAARHQTIMQELSSKLTYTQKRAAAYPPITDYLDGIVKGDTAQIQTYINTCLAVKAKYPKV